MSRSDLTGLHALGRLTETVMESDLATLRKINADAARLRSALSELATPPVAWSNLDDISALSAVARQAQLWRQWRDAQRARLNTDLAEVYALREQALAKARLGFGRDQAVKRLQREAALAKHRKHLA